MDSAIINDKSRKKFYIPLNGKEASLTYDFKDDITINLIHTFVPEEFRGYPYAKEIVKFALNYAKENHLKVIPTCPYVKKFLSKNIEEYKDLVIIK